MALDDFKTDGPRTYKDKGTVSGHNEKAIHVHDNLDTSDLDLPTHIAKHTAEYFTYIPPEEHIEGTVLFSCLECNVVGSSYDAVIKSDYLKFHEQEWIEQFRQIALGNKPDKPDMRPEDMTNDDSSDSGSGGLDSFSSD